MTNPDTNFAWFRNDLRLENSKTLETAIREDKLLTPLFILDENILTKMQVPNVRIKFLYESLFNLNKNLSKVGSKLLLIRTKPTDFFSKFSKNKIVKIFVTKDYSTLSIRRDFEIRNSLNKNSQLIHTKGNVIYDFEDNILNKEQKPYKVFTQFKIQWLNKLREEIESLNVKKKLKGSEFLAKEEVLNLENEIEGLGFEVVDIEKLVTEVANIESKFIGGEDEARKEWETFVNEKIRDYNKYRNTLSLDATSKLSPHFKFGTLSVYEVVKDCVEVLGEDFNNFKKKQSGMNAGVEMFLSEIIWREFYKYILANFPNVEKEAFQEKFREIKWENNQEKFKAWCEGKTGYPIVDACMRQLNQDGWMHNRGRMIVASFLCKDLHIDWKWGEKYFRSKLVDYDISANNGGWQWTAGVGTDAVPYFRIFNPIEQGKKFDPTGKFTKKYIPELKNVPLKYLFEPWEMSELEQIESEVVLGKDYPSPIVNHSDARKKALEMYKMSY